MAGQTKMIIITSNEDLIRQLLTNKTTNTKIIDYDHDKQVGAMASDDNNIINLSFLAELSELNSKSDQIFKRALDSPHHNRSKQMKLSKKKVDLICAICGDRAIGFNYDAPSCASCKAFFRRNAYQPPEKIQCLTGQGQCSVAHETRRKCPRCRLDRCFGAGMRKDFIVSKEVAQQKKDRLEENRNSSSKRSSTQSLVNSESLSETLDEIDRVMMDVDEDKDNTLIHESTVVNMMVDISLETLSVEDWLTIQSVRSSFSLNFPSDNRQCLSIDVSDRVSALISWSHFMNNVALSFINFFRRIDEFESLHGDDRFILIKYNLLPLLPICKSYHYRPTHDGCSHDDNEAAEKHRQLYMLCGDSTGVRQTFIDLVLLLVEATGQDATLLSLLLPVLIFSPGLSMNEDEPPLKDALAVHRAQSHYTRILWNYLIIKCGEVLAYKYFTRLLTVIVHIQSASKMFRDFFRVQFRISNTVDKLAPLLQTVLQIS